jgi:toxin ParE1/3/4
MKVLISGKARRDLLQIYSYIADRNPAAAEAVLQEIHSKIDNLSRYPFIGPERSSLASGIRGLVVGVHLIFYRIEEDHLRIYRVIDGRMDIDKEFLR